MPGYHSLGRGEKALGWRGESHGSIGHKIPSLNEGHVPRFWCESRDDFARAQELALAGAFLGVEKVRFGRRLTVEEAVDVDCRSCRVPPLLLQPLVENAVMLGDGAP